METIYGLIGFPLTHSWSAAYFKEKFKREGISHATYIPIPLSDLSRLPRMISEMPGLRGMNVTIPHKEKVLPYMDKLSATARAIGAVNTILIRRRDGEPFLEGHNTDAYGFKKSLEESGVRSSGSAMVLGTGGASRAVFHVLKEKGWEVLLVSRTPQGPQTISYQALDREHFESHQLIVNTTPLGMYPEVGTFPPIPYNYLLKSHILYDLVYNPEQTRFLEEGKRAGCQTIGGLRMLVLQAEKSWEIWNP
jgi:shikimate dehydrogenase